MTEACQHHWLLPDSEEPQVKGVCRKCGVERIFKNHLVVEKPSAWQGKYRGYGEAKEIESEETAKQGVADLDHQ